MSFALLIIGAVMLVSAVRGTQDDLFALVKGDFSGPNNFIFWLASILIIGAVGYIPKAKPVSVALLGLVVVVLFLTRGKTNGVGGGFFDQFVKQISSTQTATTSTGSVGSGSTGGGLSIPSLPDIPGISNLIH